MHKVFLPRIEANPEDPESRPQGPIMKFTDFLKIQYFLEDGFRDFIKSILVSASTEPQVDGFLATLTDGLGISIAAGLAVNMEGYFYKSDAPTVIELDAAAPALPRIDMIVAKIEANMPSTIEVGKKYREILTYADLIAKRVPLESSLDVFTELWMTATIVAKKGVAAAVPVVPALEADEIPLWEVAVAANADELIVGNLTDRRNLMRSLKDPFDVQPHTGLSKVIGPFGRILLSGLIASADELGMVKKGAGLSIAGDGTLSADFANMEILQDALANVPSYAATLPLSVVYDDAGNRWLFSVALASALASGVMSAADFSKLAASTTANTASALVQRNGSGDFNGRNIKAEGQFTFSDTSARVSAMRTEEKLFFCNYPSPIVRGAGSAARANFEIHAESLGADLGPILDMWIKIEEWTGIPVCLEAFAKETGPVAQVRLELYDYTASVVLTTIDFTSGSDAQQARSPLITFTGSGRHRLKLRYQEWSQPAGVAGAVLNLWQAALIAHPQFTNCGGAGQSFCTLS